MECSPDRPSNGARAPPHMHRLRACSRPLVKAGVRGDACADRVGVGDAAISSGFEAVEVRPYIVYNAPSVRVRSAFERIGR